MSITWFKNEQRKIKLIFALIVGLGLISSTILPMHSAYSSAILDTQINLSDNSENSTVPQMKVLGTNIFVVWQDSSTGDNEIFFKKSSDSGATFGPAINLSNTSDSDSVLPHIAISGNNVYVVWQEGPISGGEVYVIYSDDGGSTFNPATITNLSNNTGDSILPQIDISSSGVFVVWEDNDDGDYDILFTKSIGPGNSFDTPTNLSSSLTDISENPQIVSSGSNVFVTWQDDSGGSFGNSDIYFTKSSDGGTTFDPETNLSSNFANSALPQIATSGSNVYVTWRDQEAGFNDIYFIRSTDSGSSFDSILNLSNSDQLSDSPQIAASGSRVYVTWKDDTPASSNGDILFIKSTNSGASFDSLINLSGNTGISDLPEVSASGQNVQVIWSDYTFGSGQTTDILLRSSANGGSSFGGFQDVNDDTGQATTPQVVASGTRVYAIWQDDSDGDNDIYIKSGSNTPIEIAFDSTQYAIGKTATVTLTNPDDANGISGETTSIGLTSDADNTGISLDLIESGDTGVFTGQFTFTDQASSTTSSLLQVNPGDIVKATFVSDTGSVSIYSATISFDYNRYDLGSVAHITVTDPNANQDPLSAQTVTVKVVSGTDPVGIELTLTETGPDTGVFTGNPETGNADTDLIFMLGNYQFKATDTITVSAADNPSFPYNFDPNAIDYLPVTVTSTTSTLVEGTGITLYLAETGPNTSFFKGVLKFSTTASDWSTGTILVGPGDIVSVIDPTYEFTTNGMIVPNNDNSNGAIRTGLPGNVTAIYRNVNATALILDQGASGGGGGGLVRSGFVVNVLGGLFGSGGIDRTPPSLVQSKTGTGDYDPFAPIMPLKNNATSSLSINENHYNLLGYANTILPNEIQTGDKVNLGLSFLDTSKVQHVSLHFVEQSKDEISDTDPSLTFDKGTVTKSDPDGILGDMITFSESSSGTHKNFNFEFSFDKQTNRHLMITAWDENKNSANTKIFDAFQVTGKLIPSEDNHLFFEDLGQFVITSTGTVSDGNVDSLQTFPIQGYQYSDYTGRLERHDTKIYDVITQEQQRASDLVVIDNDSSDEKKPDIVKRAPQLTLSHVGHKIRDFTKTTQENSKLVKEFTLKEQLKAQKTLESMQVESKYHQKHQ